MKSKQIYKYARLVEGYRAVVHAINYVLTKTEKKDFKITKGTHDRVRNIYSKFGNDRELSKLTKNTKAYEATFDALEAIRLLEDGIKDEACVQGLRKRLFDAQRILLDEIAEDKSLCLILVKGL